MSSHSCSGARSDGGGTRKGGGAYVKQTLERRHIKVTLHVGFGNYHSGGSARERGSGATRTANVVRHEDAAPHVVFVDAEAHGVAPRSRCAKDVFALVIFNDQLASREARTQDFEGPRAR